MNVLTPLSKNTSMRKNVSPSPVNAPEVDGKENQGNTPNIQTKSTEKSTDSLEKIAVDQNGSDAVAVEADREAHRKRIEETVREYKKQRAQEETYALSPLRFFSRERSTGATSDSGMSRSTKLTLIIVVGVILWSAARIFMLRPAPLVTLKLVPKNLTFIDTKTGLSPMPQISSKQARSQQSFVSGEPGTASHGYSLIPDQHRGGGSATRHFRAGMQKLQWMAGSVGRLLQSFVRSITGRKAAPA
ncbi:hypothetical protein B484DRAFT_447176 [Ochromonadaceae sp. CCMP2298]|nr:hypothetical protein B484DRAFT_447176 [Ochromonadaceae sp. CCMP2298]